LALKEFSRLLAVAALAGLLGACGGKQEETGEGTEAAALPTAATLGEQAELPAADYLAAEPYASASRSRGERQAQFCRACHSLEKGGRHMIGPALYGFFGKEVGSQSGFEYSAVMRNANFVWTPAAMHAWLAQPGRFLPGNRMTFAGVPDERDRNDLIAYLLDVTTTADDN
jgi:cytochrome c